MADARVVELFAGVGGLRLGLERVGWRVTWSNQWEPATRTQHASECYVAHFGRKGHVAQDIARVLDAVEAGELTIPDHELLVGGYPCQDYSVARTLNQASGIEGKKGVLWWEIHRLLTLKRPRHLFLENVDRLLKSPAQQRGRDFAVMLVTLADLGYDVEWRVVNAADYGFPQRRRRVLVVGRLGDDRAREPVDVLLGGVLARALPVASASTVPPTPIHLDRDPAEVSRAFGSRRGPTPFRTAGYASGSRVWTMDLEPEWKGPRLTLGDILEPIDSVAPDYFISPDRLDTWRYLKGGKREKRTHKASGAPYFYAEGPVPFPDPTDRPSRTILTGEGGSTPSRFKHVVETADGRFRRLTPRELERLNGFPDDWTATGMTAARRAFTMGNALVVGLAERVGRELIGELSSTSEPIALPSDAA